MFAGRPGLLLFAQGMRAVLGKVQPEFAPPGLYDSRVLSGRDVRAAVNPDGTATARRM